ncbi:unnamed protein product, partial [Chrysoparadoxa australica]
TLLFLLKSVSLSPEMGDVEERGSWYYHVVESQGMRFAIEPAVDSPRHACTIPCGYTVQANLKRTPAGGAGITYVRLDGKMNQAEGWLFEETRTGNILDRDSSGRCPIARADPPVLTTAFVDPEWFRVVDPQGALVLIAPEDDEDLKEKLLQDKIFPAVARLARRSKVSTARTTYLRLSGRPGWVKEGDDQEAHRWITRALPPVDEAYETWHRVVCPDGAKLRVKRSIRAEPPTGLLRLGMHFKSIRRWQAPGGDGPMFLLVSGEGLSEFDVLDHKGYDGKDQGATVGWLPFETNGKPLFVEVTPPKIERGDFVYQVVVEQPVEVLSSPSRDAPPTGHELQPFALVRACTEVYSFDQLEGYIQLVSDKAGGKGSGAMDGWVHHYYRDYGEGPLKIRLEKLAGYPKIAEISVGMLLEVADAAGAKASGFRKGPSKFASKVEMDHEVLMPLESV